MPSTEVEIVDWFTSLGLTAELNGEKLFCVIEQIIPFNKAASPSTHHKQGRNVGIIIASLIAAKIPFIEVVPQTWQKKFSVKKDGVSDRDHKKNLWAKAREQFPRADFNVSQADSVLLALYARDYYLNGK